MADNTADTPKVNTRLAGYLKEATDAELKTLSEKAKGEELRQHVAAEIAARNPINEAQQLAASAPTATRKLSLNTQAPPPSPSTAERWNDPIPPAPSTEPGWRGTSFKLLSPKPQKAPILKQDISAQTIYEGSDPSSAQQKAESQAISSAQSNATTILMDGTKDVITRIADARKVLADAKNTADPVKLYIETKFPKVTDEKAKQKIYTMLSGRLAVRDSQEAAAALIDEQDYESYRVTLEKQRDYITAFGKANAVYGIHTFRDLVEFADPKEYIGSEQTDWSQFFSELINEGQISEQFKRSMASKYGPHWGLRFAAYGAKEIGIDAALLFISAVVPPLAPLAWAGKGATITRRASAVAVRAGIVAVGGTGQQALIDAYLGEKSNYALELTGRFTGSVAGEAIGAVAKGMFKVGTNTLQNAFRRTPDLLEKAGIPVFRPKGVVQEAMRNDPPLLRIVQKATLHKESEQYRQMTVSVSQGLTNPQKETMETIRELTGIDPADQAQILGLGRDIYGSALFKDVRYSDTMKSVKLRVADLDTKVLRISGEMNTAQHELNDLLKIKDIDSSIKRRITNLQTKINNLADEKAAYDYELENLYKLADDLSDTITTSRFPLADAVIMNDAVGFRIMYNAANVRQRTVQDIGFTYILGREVQHREADTVNFIRNGKINANTYLEGLKTITNAVGVTEPDAQFGYLAKDAFDAFNRTESMGSQFQNMLEVAQAGLNKRQRAEVWAAVEKGALEERLYTPNDLTSKFMFSPDQIDMYFSVRKIMDFAHMQLDKYYTNFFKTRNVFSYNGIPVQVNDSVGGILTKDLKDVGYVRARVLNDSAGEQTTEILLKMSQLKELQTVLPYRAGYVSRIYKDANYAGMSINLDTGTVSRTHVFKTYKDATDWQAAASTQKGSIPIVTRWSDNTNLGFVGMPGNALDAMSVLDDVTYQSIKQQLADAGKNAEQIKLILEQIDGTSLRRAFLGARADQQLKTVGNVDAPLLPTGESIANYIQYVARQSGVGEWRDWAVSEWSRRFEAVINKNVFWADPNAIKASGDYIVGSKFSRAQFEELRSLARQEQLWISRLSTQQTTLERQTDNFLRRNMEMLTDRGVDTKLLEKFMPETARLNRIMRGIGFIPNLAFGNLSQVLVQGSQALASVGMHPLHAVAGMKDALEALAAYAVKTSVLERALRSGTTPMDVSKMITQNGEQFLFALERSGWLSNVKTTDMVDLVQVNDKPFKQAAQFVSNLPLTIGEGVNRIAAFATVRREFIDKIAKVKAGKLRPQDGVIGKNGKPFQGAIDDDEFLSLVTNKAKITALNMGKAGQLKTFSGYGSWIFQFMQVYPKYLNMFATTELSIAEKSRIAATMFGTMGIHSLPFIAVVQLFDWTAWQVEQAIGGSRPTRREMFSDLGRRFGAEVADTLSEYTPEQWRNAGFDSNYYMDVFKKGAIAAESKRSWAIGELNIANRVALGSFLYEQFSANRDVTDWVVSVSVLSDMYTATKNLADAGLLNPASYLELMSAYAQGREEYMATFADIFGMEPESAALKLLNESGRVVSYFGAIGRYLSNEYPELSDPTFKKVNPHEPQFAVAGSRKLPTVMSHAENLQNLLGIQPGRIAQVHSEDDYARLYEDAAKVYINRLKEKITNAPVQDVPILIHEHAAELNELKYTLMRAGIRENLANEMTTSLISTIMNRMEQSLVPSLDRR